MSLIPAGEFQMGSDKFPAAFLENPKHSVCLDAFYIDKHEVTLAQYLKFAIATKRYEQAASEADLMRAEQIKQYADTLDTVDAGEILSHPVNYVSWYDAKDYCSWAGKRLPTEAEWEKAARGGADTLWFFGDEPDAIDEYAWTDNNGPHPVGLKKPNQHGLYDIYGNVWEWVFDRVNSYEHYYANSEKKNPQGPATGKKEVRGYRGGSGTHPSKRKTAAYTMRSGNRNWFDAKMKVRFIGLRCAASKP
ncbi:MAG TPA: SUMF1/EgtB/PvdO family nonheme iron enzyme [Elusimicrobiales bacterium]|nr:SUMF1/EgtB/PvdO family nonheme iron enzyme [Elusimicrobiales bacterium]